MKQYDVLLESLKILKSIAAQLAASPEKPIQPRKINENTGEQKSEIKARNLSGSKAAGKRREIKSKPIQNKEITSLQWRLIPFDIEYQRVIFRMVYYQFSILWTVIVV